jgi:hypothetical protein
VAGYTTQLNDRIDYVTFSKAQSLATLLQFGGFEVLTSEASSVAPPGVGLLVWSDSFGRPYEQQTPPVRPSWG